MKKVLVFGAIAGVLLLALGAAGLVYAQSQTALPPVPGFGSGMMGGQQGFGRGMMGGDQGVLHDYMVASFAEALGLAPEELQARLEGGETMYQLAEAQGLSLEDFQELMTEARTAAFDQAVADGVLSQDQADWMSQHMAQKQAAGFGPGFCHGSGTGVGASRGQRGASWRWSQQP